MALGFAVMKRSALHSLHERTFFARSRPIPETSFPPAGGRRGFQRGTMSPCDGSSLAAGDSQEASPERPLVRRPRRTEKQNQRSPQASLPNFQKEEKSHPHGLLCAVRAGQKIKCRKASQGFPTKFPRKKENPHLFSTPCGKPTGAADSRFPPLFRRVLQTRTPLFQNSFENFFPPACRFFH